VTGSACFEQGRKTGGTAEHIRSFVWEGKIGRPARIVNLEGSPKIERMAQLDDLTEGEYIFWRSLEEVLSMNIDKLKVASMVMIKEPAKPRVVTKARASLKIVLDVISGICSAPLKKVASSASGMGRAHHGWNFFKEFYTSWRKTAFQISERESDRVNGEDGPIYVTDYFENFYVSMTDYSEATDRMLHRTVAEPMADLWMRKCGIPKLLRGIVHATCFGPRTIFFRATAAMEKIGEKFDDKYNKVVLRRGVLMGDPLTKVILHLTNIGVRETGNLFLDEEREKYPDINPLVGEYMKKHRIRSKDRTPAKVAVPNTKRKDKRKLVAPRSIRIRASTRGRR